MRTIAALLLVTASLPTYALVETGSAGDVTFTIYAPDWTWQKQMVNVLYVLENKGSGRVPVSLSLQSPAGAADHFQVADTEFQKVNKADALTISRDMEIAPGAVVRGAFANIMAADGVPKQTYPFDLRIAAGKDSWRGDYPLKTIRGAAVSSARWALYTPVCVALLWSGVLALVLRKFAGKQAAAKE
jgi:hypothetical protein